MRKGDFNSDHNLQLIEMSMRCKVQKPEKKAENVAIQTDQLKERKVRMKLQAKLLGKMNEWGLSRKESRREELVWKMYGWTLRRV